MIASRDKIGVIHLVWLPYGIDLFRQFIDSYVKFNSGREHMLLLIFNGVKGPADTAPYHDYSRSLNIDYNSIDVKKGQDLDCYFNAAQKLSAVYIMILNSFSVILSEHWLRKYADSFDDPQMGLAAATASCQSYYSSVFQKNVFPWEKNKNFLYNFGKYRLFIKAFLYWRFLFRPFPNPHIRTNAFMIRRDLFLQLRHPPFTSKFAAYQFESGRNSLTTQVLKLGYKVRVVDKDGKLYQQQDWHSSKTFWAGNQENLLVSDNQTRIYAAASSAEKRKMTWLAWGIK